MPDLAEYLYWDSLADVASDDTGFWEIAWRANTVSGGAGSAERVAADVIQRLVAEGLARVVNLETRAPIEPADVLIVLNSPDWAASQNPRPMVGLVATDRARDRLAEMPPDVVALMSEGDLNRPTLDPP